MSNGDTIVKYIVPVIGAVVVALQGVNLHETSSVGNEAARAEKEMNGELRVIQALQKEKAESQQRQETIIADIGRNYTVAQKRIDDIEASLARIETKLGTESEKK
jgi:hypothetical protein